MSRSGAGGEPLQVLPDPVVRNLCGRDRCLHQGGQVASPLRRLLVPIPVEPGGILVSSQPGGLGPGAAAHTLPGSVPAGDAGSSLTTWGPLLHLLQVSIPNPRRSPVPSLMPG